MRSRELKNTTYRQSLFCRHYAIHGNAARAARESGYSQKFARQVAYELLNKPHVKEKISELKLNVCEKLQIKAEEVHAVAASIALHDATKICQMRHMPCRECWPKWYEEAAEAEREARKLADAMGEEYVADEMDGRRPEFPDPDCRECHGDGELQVWFQDTRLLTGFERRAFAAASLGREGYKVDLSDKLKALDICAKLAGLYKDVGDDKNERVNVYFNGMRFPPEPATTEGKKP